MTKRFGGRAAGDGSSPEVGGADGVEPDGIGAAATLLSAVGRAALPEHDDIDRARTAAATAARVKPDIVTATLASRGLRSIPHKAAPRAP